MSDKKEIVVQHDVKVTGAAGDKWSAAPRFYSNNVRVTASTYDVLFFIGEAEPELNDANEIVSVRIGARAIVTMSHDHARAFAAALQDVLGKLNAQATAKDAKPKR